MQSRRSKIHSSIYLLLILYILCFTMGKIMGESPAKSTIRVYPGEKIGNIHPWIYGHFLEPIHHSIDGGLHAEMLLERSFDRQELLPRIWVLGNHFDPPNQDLGIPNVPPQYTPTWGEGEGSLFRTLLIGDEGRFIFGEDNWSDYTIQLKARKWNEPDDRIAHVYNTDGFRIIFRAQDEQNFYWWSIGGWHFVYPYRDESGHGVEIVRRRHANTQPQNPAYLLDKKEGSIETDRWYDVKISVKGDHIQCWLDGIKVHDLRDQTFAKGKVGLDCRNNRVEFKDLKVTADDGKVLYESQFSNKSLPYYNEDPPPAMLWQRTDEKVEKVSVKRVKTEPFHGNHCLRIKIDQDIDHAVGVYQEHINVKANEKLDGYIYLRGNQGGSVEVGLRSRGNKKIYARQIIDSITDDWQKYPFELNFQENDGDAEFYIVVDKVGEYYFDQVSLMPLHNRLGLPYRDDLLQAVKELRPSIIRWPGGCFATHYNWQDGIGPIDERPSTSVFDWDSMGGSEPNTLGTDEFIALCKEVDAEPFIVLNIGAPFSKQRMIHPDRNLDWFIEDALNWIEYCNGSADSKWGSIRAENGHPEPYNVRVWGIDNELWSDWYAEIAPKFCDAIRKKYPELKLVVVGSVMHGTKAFGAGPINLYHSKIIPAIGDRTDYVSVHSYWESSFEELVTSVLDMEKWFEHQSRIYKFYIPEKDVKISFDEWNPGRLDFKAGMGTAAFLNCLERKGDIVEIAAPALFLRHQKLHPENWFNNALLNHNHKTWFPSVTYLVMKLWSEHRAPDLIKSEINDPVIIYNNQPFWILDVVATEDKDNNKVIVKILNRSIEKDVEAHIDLVGLKDRSVNTATCFIVSSKDLQDQNTFREPENIVVQKIRLEVVENKISSIVPRHSAGLIELILSN